MENGLELPDMTADDCGGWLDMCNENGVDW